MQDTCSKRGHFLTNVKQTKKKSLHLVQCTHFLFLYSFYILLLQKAPWSEGGECETHWLQGVCSGAVGCTGGSGKEAGGANWCSGEREVSGILHLLPCCDFSVSCSSSLAHQLSCFPLLRLACRDIGGSDPERMAAPRVADYVQDLFKDSPVQVVRNIIWCALTASHDTLHFIVRRKSTVIYYSS